MRKIVLPNITLIVLQGVLGTLGTMETQLKDVLGALKDFTLGAKKPRWARHIPQLAGAFANMIDLDPNVFTWLLFSAADLRNQVQTVELLREIKVFLDRMSTSVGDALNLYKDQLFEVTNDGVAGLVAAQKSPLTDPAVQGRLEKLSEAVMTIVNDRNTAIGDTRKTNKKVKQKSQAQLDGLTQENEILRGKTLPQPAPPRRSSKGRKAKR